MKLEYPKRAKVTKKMRLAIADHWDAICEEDEDMGWIKIEIPPSEKEERYIMEMYDCSESDVLEIYLMIHLLPRMYNLYGGYGGMEQATRIGKPTWHSWMKKFQITVNRVAITAEHKGSITSLYNEGKSKGVMECSKE